MKTLVSLFIMVLLAVSAAGQGLSVAESPKKPGDIIRYTITFERPVGSNVTQINVSFRLTTELRKDQNGLPTHFELTKFSQKSPSEYEVEGAIPDAMSGTYLLGAIQIRTADGGIRDYAYPNDFTQENNVKVENVTKDIFPKIKSVTPSH